MAKRCQESLRLFGRLIDEPVGEQLLDDPRQPAVPDDELLVPGLKLRKIGKHRSLAAFRLVHPRPPVASLRAATETHPDCLGNRGCAAASGARC